MTNFEYLQKFNLLEDFIEDMHIFDWSVIHQKYGIDSDVLISDWLQKEYNTVFIIQIESDSKEGVEAYKIKKVNADSELAKHWTEVYPTFVDAQIGLIKFLQKVVKSK